MADTMESYKLENEQEQGGNDKPTASNNPLPSQGSHQQPPAYVPPPSQGSHEQPPVAYQPPAAYVPPPSQGSHEQPPVVYQQPAAAPMHGYYGPPPVLQQPYQQQNTTNNTTVVVTGLPQAPAVTQPRPWTSGLLGCFDDCGICMEVVCCYAVSTARLASATGENRCMPCWVPNWLTALRAKVRTQLNIQGSICDDCMAVTCCHVCALCQLKREVKIAQQGGLM